MSLPDMKKKKPWTERCFVVPLFLLALLPRRRLFITRLSPRSLFPSHFPLATGAVLFFCGGRFPDLSRKRFFLPLPEKRQQRLQLRHSPPECARPDKHGANEFRSGSVSLGQGSVLMLQLVSPHGGAYSERYEPPEPIQCRVSAT